MGSQICQKDSLVDLMEKTLMVDLMGSLMDDLMDSVIDSL